MQTAAPRDLPPLTMPPGCHSAHRPASSSRRALTWPAAGRLVFALLSAAPLLSMGCAPYRIGTAELYPTDIRTVYVPIFTSSSFRRNLGERLTEAVMKEIELQTPYKVVSSPAADSILSGQIVADSKRVIVEAPTDEPRQLEATISVQVTWVDRRGSQLRPMGAVPLPAALLPIGGSAKLVPEVGQSITTAQQDAIEELASQIVSLMEMPW